MVRLLLPLLLVSATTFMTLADKPHIILIMADDVGIEGIGCYGGVTYRTPNLDRLASQGMRFTQAYSQPLCTPTRIQLMTGKYNHRNWSSFGILRPDQQTFGHAMRDAGYATAIFGKWQLYSYDPPDLPGATQRRGTGMHPKDAGFDEYALFHALETENKGSRYANPSMLEGTAGDPGKLRTYAGRYGEDVWVEKILDFIDRQTEKPSFVYYPMALPHWPFQPTPNSDDWDPTAVQPTDLKYNDDMIEYMDTAVGNLLQGLADRKLDEKTIVLFYSDNGTHMQVTSEFADGRMIPGGKATTRQTGIHVPLIVRWTGKIVPSISDDIVDASDFFPTLLDLAGAALPRGNPIDGISFAPRLFGKDGPRRETAFFWYDPRPGWDKERFHRSVFAVNRTHKLFRSGRLFRLSDQPLEETEVDPLQMTAGDRAAVARLQAAIDDALKGVEEPPLVDAYGRPQHDLLYQPKDRNELDRINRDLLETGSAVHYGEGTADEQKLWIFNPLDIDDDELRPCVVFFHGGGWGGDPSLFAAQCVYLQRRGFNAVSVHFRAPTGSLTPADTLRDARLAYRWIVDQGAEHHIDADRLIISGGSAGGHLALALCTIGLDDDPVIDRLPKGMVLFNPVIDLVDGWSSGRKKCERQGIDPRSFSPAHHVRPGLPPLLVMSGSNDSLIPPRLLQRFRDDMHQAGNRCEVILYPGAKHGFFNYGREPSAYFQQTMWRFEAFLQHVLP